MTKEQAAYIKSTKEYHKQLELCIEENDLQIKNHKAIIKNLQDRIASEERQKAVNKERLRLHQNLFNQWKRKSNIK